MASNARTGGESERSHPPENQAQVEWSGRELSAPEENPPPPAANNLWIQRLPDMFGRYNKTGQPWSLALMISQAFFYNAIFFTYALVLTKFYNISGEKPASISCPLPWGIFLARLRSRAVYSTPLDGVK